MQGLSYAVKAISLSFAPVVCQTRIRVGSPSPCRHLSGVW